MGNVISTAPAAWMSAKDASTHLCVSLKIIARLGDQRKLTRRCVPGSAPKYLRADVERLAIASTTLSVDAMSDPETASA